MESLNSNNGRKRRENEKKTIVALELRLNYPLNKILKVLQLAKSSYFYNLNKLSSKDKNFELKVLIKAIYHQNKERYGYRRIQIGLENQGIHINHKKLQRLMNEMHLQGKTVRKAKYSSYRGDMNGTVSNKLLDEIDNKIVRNFKTTSINQKWVTDVTEFKIASGKLYLSPIMDIHTNEIISYKVSKNPDLKQTLDMIQDAINKFDDLKGLIIHSDQGWQYQHYAFHKILEKHGIIQSMSRKGNCLDNCRIENFFGKMKIEMFYGKENEFKTLEELETAIDEYIDYYNNERISIKLKGLTPVEYRNQTLQMQY